MAVATVSVGAVGLWGAGLVLFHPARLPRSTAAPPLEPAPVETTGEGTFAVFASADGVRLHLVSSRVVAVAFHEASYPDAVALRPRGVCLVCRNPTKFHPPPPRRTDLEYLVLDTRGRAQAATSAVDVLVPRGAEVLSPVDGVVRRVKHYRLYGRYPDVRLEIRPAGAPDRRLVLLHLQRVRLVPGQRVEASETPLGEARRFPFESHVDRYVRGRFPHVHMEVKDPAARVQKR